MSEQTEKITIPDKHIEICKEFAKIAYKYGLGSLNLSYRPKFMDEWRNDIHLKWEAGRHGEDMNEFRVTSEFRENICMEWEEMGGESEAWKSTD